MVDTVRTKAEIQALWADNTTGAQSNQDTRDGFVTAMLEPHVFIAASDATQREKDHADYLCDGTADDVQINAALAALPATGGKVELSSGTFTVANTVNVVEHATNLIGAGAGNYGAASQGVSGTNIKAASTFVDAVVLNVALASGIVPLHMGAIRDFTVDVNDEESGFTPVTITSSSVAHPTVISATAHGLTSGQSVRISGHAGGVVVGTLGSTPNINNIHTVTVTGANTFTIDVNVTTGGTGGTVTRVVNGILWRSIKGSIERIRVFQATGYGIKTHGFPQANGDWDGTGWDVGDTKIGIVEIGECATVGMWSALESPDLQIDKLTCWNNGINWLIQSGSQQISTSHFFNATTNNIKIEGGASRSKFANLKIEGAENAGVHCDALFGSVDDLMWVNCGILGNSDNNDNTYDNVHAFRTSGSNGIAMHFIGGVIGGKSEDGGAIARYDINMADDSCVNWTIVGVAFAADSLTGTAHINDNRTTTVAVGALIRDCSNLWKGILTWAPATVPDHFANVDARQTTTHTFTGVQTGVKIGDRVTVTSSISQGGLILHGYVSAANVVTLMLINLTGAAVSPASATYAVSVERG